MAATAFPAVDPLALPPIRRVSPLQLRFIGNGNFGSFMRETLISYPVLTDSAVNVLAPYSRSSGLTFHENVSNSPDVDAIYVCTPDHLHTEQTAACLKGGKHVLVEKPLTDFHQIQSILRITPAAEGVRPVLRVGFHRRYDAEFVGARECAAAAGAGCSITIESRDPVPAEDPMSFILANSVVHDLDMAVWLLTKPGGALPHLTIQSLQVDPATGFADLRLSSDDGARVHIIYSKAFDTYRQWVTVESTRFGYDLAPTPGAHMCAIYVDAYRRQWYDFVDAVTGRQAGDNVASAELEARLVEGYSRTFRLLDSCLRMEAAQNPKKASEE